MLVLLTNGELTAFDRLMKYGEPLLIRKAHPCEEIYSNKYAAGLKTLLVEYVMKQNRYLTGKERNPKTREELKEANGGIPLLTDLCLAMRSDTLGMIRGLGEVLTCIYEPAVTSARGGISAFSAAREPNKYARWNGAELVQARRVESLNPLTGDKVEVLRIPA